MTVQNVFVSDMSGDVIDPNETVEIKISRNNRTIISHLSESEFNDALDEGTILSMLALHD